MSVSVQCDLPNAKHEARGYPKGLPDSWHRPCDFARGEDFQAAQQYKLFAKAIQDDVPRLVDKQFLGGSLGPGTNLIHSE